MVGVSPDYSGNVNPQPGSPTYSWSNGGTTSSISGLAAGTYTVTITTVWRNIAFLGTYRTCTTVKSTSISAGTCCIGLALTSTFDCGGASNGTATVTASGNGPFTYSWSSGASSATATGLAAGIYSVSVSDGGCTRVGTVEVLSSTLPNLSVIGTDPSCPGTSDGSSVAITFQLFASGITYNYNWSGPGGYTNSGTDVSGFAGFSSHTISNLYSGTYNVTLTDQKGCTISNSATLTDPSAIVSNAVVTNPSCYGFSDGSVVVEATGGSPFFGLYGYSWSTGDNGNTAGPSSITNLSDGVYSLTITDDNGCTLEETYNVDEPDTMIAYGRPSVAGNYNLPVRGSNAGSIRIYVSGGNGGQTYSWMGPGSPIGAWPTGLGAGQYVVTVTDPKGCVAVGGVFNLIEP